MRPGLTSIPIREKCILANLMIIVRILLKLTLLERGFNLLHFVFVLRFDDISCGEHRRLTLHVAKCVKQFWSVLLSASSASFSVCYFDFVAFVR